MTERWEIDREADPEPNQAKKDAFLLACEGALREENQSWVSGWLKQRARVSNTSGTQ